MTQLEILTNAIDIWEGFCFNYRSNTKDGITYPAVLDKIKGNNVDAQYMRNKWAEVCDRYGCAGSAALHIFFSELDRENRQALVAHAFGKDK